MRLEYFLDWRPIAALPAVPVKSPKLFRLDRQQLRAQISIDGIARAIPFVPRQCIDAFVEARALARRDGIFVFEISIDPQAPFDNNSLDELSQLVSWSFKKAMHHTHDVHALPNQDGGTRDNLSADTLLTVKPIALDQAIWNPLFDAGSFEDTHLKLATAPGIPHNPLVALRFAFIQLSDRCIQLLDTDRLSQIAWRAQPANWVRNVLISLLITVFVFFAFSGFPASWAAFFALVTSYKFIIAAACEAYLGTIFFIFRRQFRRWDRPRIRFLRSAVNYFQYVNPFNAVASFVCHRDHSRIGSFDNIVAILSTKLHGEEHRGNIDGMWMSLAVGAAGLLLAALAVDTATSAPGKLDIARKYYVVREFVREVEVRSQRSETGDRATSSPRRQTFPANCTTIYRSIGRPQICCMRGNRSECSE